MISTAIIAILSVLADRPVEHDALVGVARRALDEPASVADALGGNQDALRVQTVE